MTLLDENGNKLGESKIAAKHAITMVTVSRILMATPGMCKFLFFSGELIALIWLTCFSYSAFHYELDGEEAVVCGKSILLLSFAKQTFTLHPLETAIFECTCASGIGWIFLSLRNSNVLRFISSEKVN